MADTSPTRPRKVVVVDAENPLVEVQGEFFWREDHEAIVAAAREQAYRQGYADGHVAGADRRAVAPVTPVVLRRRRSLLSRVLTKLGLVMLGAAFAAAVIMTLVDQLATLR